jgi:hypothetical protein
LIQSDLFQFNRQRAALRHGVPGVDAEIHQHLLDLGGVGQHGAGFPGGAGLDGDGAGENLMGDAFHFMNEMLGIQHDPLTFQAAGEQEHLADDIGPAGGTGFQRLQQSQLSRFLRAFLEQLHGHHDGGQHIVQIMGQAAGERADAFQTLGPQQLDLQFLFFRDVGVDHQNGLGGAIPPAHQIPLAVHHQLAARAIFLPQLAGPFVVRLHGLQGPDGFVRIQGQLQFRDGPAPDLGHAPAIQMVRPLIPVEDPAGEIAHINRLLRDVQQRRLGTQLFIVEHVPGDVPGKAEGADDFSPVVAEWQLVGQGPGLAAIRPDFLPGFAQHRFAGADDLLFLREGLAGVFLGEKIKIGFADQLIRPC